MINKYLETKKSKYLLWSIEFDSNTLMDPNVMESINWWRTIIDTSNKNRITESALIMLNNIGIALLNFRDTSKDFHYDSGFVHSYRIPERPIITFEVHPPRRCFRLIENFEKLIEDVNVMKLSNKDIQSRVSKKFKIKDINTNFSDPVLISAQIISQTHNKISKHINETDELFLTPFLAEKIYSDAVNFKTNLNYIVDTFQEVDYWDPDKKR